MFDNTTQPSTENNDREAALALYREVRGESERLAADLEPEDQSIQSMPDVSPTKWHLAHTTWFFETFILARFDTNYRVFDPAFAFLFNSYYEAAGPRHPRPERGLLSRPTVATVAAYRAHVDAAMANLVEGIESNAWSKAAPLIELGRHHEQQHQELILMDIKHVFSVNPLLPAYRDSAPQSRGNAPETAGWIAFGAGLVEIGHRGAGFAFDNEGPRHKVWLDPFALATHPVSCARYLEFIEDGGYRRPEFWLSDGWAAVLREAWAAPLYWSRDGDGWAIFTLSGRRRLDPDEPVCHVSFYEADAFARWAGKRLPTEAEWELAAVDLPVTGNFVDHGRLHPSPDEAGEGEKALPMRQMFGDIWEWTASPYIAYPRFRPSAGAIGEYNGKFMSNQMVLKGGAAVTPKGHVRASYRNFFPPAARWAFAGLRLAEDL